MWMMFGLLAIAATLFNLYTFSVGKDYKLPMAVALSLTALTLCAEYSLISMWVEAEDWGALADVVPGMERALWLLTLISIGLNMLPIFLERSMKKRRL
ncbi:putative membrane protein [Exiguobacterium sp. S17]|nr:putative membrane protein [Exiguobacterium sp. S17]